MDGWTPAGELFELRLHLRVDLVQTLDADYKEQLSLGRGVVAVFGLGLSLQANQLVLLWAELSAAMSCRTNPLMP